MSLGFIHGEIIQNLYLPRLKFVLDVWKLEPKCEENIPHSFNHSIGLTCNRICHIDSLDEMESNKSSIVSDEQSEGKQESEEVKA